MNHRERQEWASIRAKGRAHFIFSGIFSRGGKFAVPFTVTFFFIDLLRHHTTNPLMEAIYLITLFVLLTLLVGWGEGEYLWITREQTYQWDKQDKAVD